MSKQYQVTEWVNGELSFYRYVSSRTRYEHLYDLLTTFDTKQISVEYVNRYGHKVRTEIRRIV